MSARGIAIIIFSFLLNIHSLVRGQTTFAETDVLHYDAEIEPDIKSKSVRGVVTITFEVVRPGKIKFDCGGLEIKSIRSKGQNIPFEIKNNTLLFDVSGTGQRHDVDIEYNGLPPRGINFFPEHDQVYTVFSTSQWLVCKDTPDDKATLRLRLITPSNVKVIATGEMETSTSKETKVISEWNQTNASPTYTFGFAVGPFTEVTDSRNALRLRYLSSEHSQPELTQIFAETKNMIQFFEERSGVPYPGKSYTQVLALGNVSQEMAGFAVMRLSYGKQVLDNASEINLGAHELAHQWWGNNVTCLNWNHFWLNEGLAVFMSSAFKEQRFGHDHYLKDISIYKNAYEKVVEKKADKPLIFKSWLNPTADDRTLVYYKGAYVFHLLREKLGEEVFWMALKEYSTAHFGKSVVSSDLQNVMEKVSGSDLDKFFGQWVNP